MCIRDSNSTQNIAKNGELHLCTEDECSYQHRLIAKVREHVKTYHKGIRYNCGLCEHKSSSRGNLKHHYRKRHIGQDFPKQAETSVFEIKCEECDFKGNSRSRLRLHMKTEHGRYVSCAALAQSGKVFTNSRSSTYKCDKCDYKTVTYIKLNRHKHSHHECNQCDYQSKSVEDLKLHNYYKHGGCLLYTSDAADE